MAVYKGDTQEEIDATDAYNMALQTLAESSVPLAAGGDFASTIRKNWPVGQMKFERGGYAGKGFVKPVAGAVEEAIAAAKKLMTSEPVSVRAPDPYVKGVNDPKPELQQAIKDFYAGKLTREDYDNIVRRVSPVEPYDFIPQPSLEHLAVDALNAAKKDKYGMNRDIYQEGDPVSLRLDIPAYTNLPNSQWVNSIHDTRGVHPTTYDSVSAARNVDFVVPENKARMTGEGGPKAPYAVMRGEYVPITAEEAVAQAQEIMGGPLPSQWQQVGMDPRRHSYFYTRDERMMPVTNADEVLQIGPVVYAKNPKVGDRGDFGYARGGYATEGYVEQNDPENFSSAGVMKPAGVKEWDSPTYLERLKHFLADHGPQTGTGRPTLGGERVASGVQRVLELLPVTGNIESGQRAYRDFKRGDNIEGALNSLGALMPLNAYSEVAHGATPMVRAGNAAMLLPNTIPSDENALLPEVTMDIPERYARGGYATQGGVKAVAKGVQAGEQAIQDALRIAKDFMSDKLQGPASSISDKMLIPPAANTDVSAPRIAKRTAKPAQQFPELTERYPEVLPGLPSVDAVTGKEYIAKDLSDEAKAVGKARAIAQKEIKAGNYDPYFPPENRSPVDKGLFPEFDYDTTQIVAKRPDTFQKYQDIANDPRAEQSLIQAILRGKKDEDTAGGWYHMNQLLDKYLEVYGPEMGPEKFKRNFAESMAATTGGMSPTNNFMLAHYGNFHANQTPWPSNAPQQLSLGAYDMPYPIAAGKMGLRNNADAFNKMILEANGITPDNPKRFDFAGNFLGQDRAVMDDQMMTGGWGRINPRLAGAPPSGMYGHFARKVGEIGSDLGMSPSNAQELGWFGFKGQNNPGKDIRPQPMIEDINQAIERTHRITGMPHDEIVARGVVKQEIPLYADGGAVDHALRIANLYDQ